MHVILDSRLVKPGDYFVPVIGENSDGHKYIDAAMQNGAVGIIEVEDLFDLAKKKLSQIGPKIIAITGSVGKSTTKDYTLQLLKTQFKVCDGYLNTKLGLATTIVNDMSDDCEVFVAECGMDRKGELLETGIFLNPDVVVLTNISESHMEKLGSIEAIKEAKAELIRTVKPGGIGFFNITNKYVVEVVKKYPPSKIEMYGDNFEKILIDNTAGISAHNLMNLQCAYKISKYFGILNEDLVVAIKNITSPKGRLNKLVGINDSIIIDDTYNASPVSTIAALNYVADLSKEKSLQKIAVLGGLLELGPTEDEGHKKVGDAIADLKFDLLILVGELSKKYLLSDKLKNSNIQIIEMNDSTSAGNYLQTAERLSNQDVVLVKGSQGIRMEKTVSLILKDPLTAKDLLVRQDVRWNN